MSPLFYSHAVHAQEHEATTESHAQETHETTAHADDHGHGHGAIPFGNIGVQAFNLVFLLVLLGFLMRKAIRAHFAQRASSYRELVERAESARLEAERNHKEIKDRLSKLEASASETLTRAQSEAADLRNRMMAEAKSISTKLEQEAQRTAALEIEKAKAELRSELLTRSLASAQESMRKGLGSPEQKKLQNEFAEKIEVVGR